MTCSPRDVTQNLCFLTLGPDILVRLWNRPSRSCPVSEKAFRKVLPEANIRVLFINKTWAAPVLIFLGNFLTSVRISLLLLFPISKASKTRNSLSKMVCPCPSHFSGDHDDGTKTKLDHCHRMSNDDSLHKAESLIAPSVRQNLFTCFAFLRPRKSEKYTEQIRRQNLERRTPTPSIIPALSFARMACQVDATPYAWPISGGMNPKTTALVIIDMQKDCEYHLHVSVIFQLKPQFIAHDGQGRSPVSRRITCFLSFTPTNMSNISRL